MEGVANRDDGDAVLGGTGDRDLAGMLGRDMAEPVPGIERQARAGIDDDLAFGRGVDRALRNPLQIHRQLEQTVRGKALDIGIDEGLSH